MSERLNEAARALAEGGSRRQALRLLTGGVLGLLTGAARLDRRDAAARSHKGRRRRERAHAAGTASKVTLCHKPGTADASTLQLAGAAVAAHLAHGDSLGPCCQGPQCVCPSGLTVCDAFERQITCANGCGCLEGGDGGRFCGGDIDCTSDCATDADCPDFGGPPFRCVRKGTCAQFATCGGAFVCVRSCP